MSTAALDLVHLDDAIWVAHRTIHSPAYDFAFDRFFPCRRPYSRPNLVPAIGRLGALPSYDEEYARFSNDGIRLINSPAEHALASELPHSAELSIAGISPFALWSEIIRLARSPSR